MYLYHGFIQRLNKVTEFVTMFFLVMMVVLIFVQIVSRVLIGSSFSWTEEVARYLMIWVAFLGAGFAFQYGAHMSIEVLFKKINLNMQNIFQIISAILCTLFFLLLIVKGIELIKGSINVYSPALKLPMTIVYAAIPIGAFLQILNVIDITWKFFKNNSRVGTNE